MLHLEKDTSGLYYKHFKFYDRKLRSSLERNYDRTILVLAKAS